MQIACVCFLKIDTKFTFSGGFLGAEINKHETIQSPIQTQIAFLDVRPNIEAAY